jgi:hypothetical protein
MFHFDATKGAKRGVPLLAGAIFSTGVSILLWSAIWAGWSLLR